MFTKIIGALGVTMVLGSCATVVRGVHEDLKVVSEPAGADVSLKRGKRSNASDVSKRRREIIS